MCAVAEQVNRLGEFDAVIHNAGIGYRGSRRIETEDRLPALFATNTRIRTAMVWRSIMRCRARWSYFRSVLATRTKCCH
jgi:hypothetical protein